MNDFRQCYTCKIQFNGYYSLMEHRKNVQPSSKKCRNFPGNCTFLDGKCWYVHDEPMEIDSVNDIPQRSWNFKCNLCAEEFIERDSFMKHRKNTHKDTNLECLNFKRGNCQRTEDRCWYMHITANKDTKSSSSEQVFQQVPSNLPPEQVAMMFQMVNNLFQKMEKKESVIQKLIQ